MPQGHLRNSPSSLGSTPASETVLCANGRGTRPAGEAGFFPQQRRSFATAAIALGAQAKNAKSSIIHIEGDPDHPINRGTLCPKGAALLDFIKAPTRLLYPEYRAPGTAEWKRVSWATERIAKLVEEDRDKNFIAKNKDSLTLNR